MKNISHARNSAPSFNQHDIPQQKNQNQADEDEQFFKRLKLQAMHPNADVKRIDQIAHFRESNPNLKAIQQLVDLITPQQLNQLKLMIKPSNQIFTSILSVLTIFAGIEADFIPNSYKERLDIQWVELQLNLRTPHKILQILKNFERYLFEDQINASNLVASAHWVHMFDTLEESSQIHPTAQKLILIAKEALTCYNSYQEHISQQERISKEAIIIRDENQQSQQTAKFSELNESAQLAQEDAEEIERISVKPIDESVKFEERVVHAQQAAKMKVSSSPPIRLNKVIPSKQENGSTAKKSFRKKSKEPKINKSLTKQQPQTSNLNLAIKVKGLTDSKRPLEITRGRSPQELRVPRLDAPQLSQRKLEKPYSSEIKDDLVSPVEIKERIRTESRELSKVLARESDFKWQVEREAKKIQQWIEKDSERREYEFLRSQSQKHRRLEEQQRKHQKSIEKDSKEFVFELGSHSNRRFVDNENAAYKKYLSEYANKYLMNDTYCGDDDIKQLRSQLQTVQRELQQRSESLGRIQQKQSQVSFRLVKQVQEGSKPLND